MHPVSDEKRQITCNFDDPFICGYKIDQSGTFSWSYLTAAEAGLLSGNILAQHPLAGKGTYRFHKVILLPIKYW